MGVSLPGGGSGRARSVNAELNLVPFIDLLCSIITFLLATAVWSQTEVIAVDQAVGPPEMIDDFEPHPPPMTLHVRADGVWIGRNVETGKNYPKNSGAYDWTRVEADLAADHDAFPEETQVVLVTDDGVPYEHMVMALDLSRAHGYEQTLLAGGPAALSTPRSPG